MLCQTPQRTYIHVAHSSTFHASNWRCRAGDHCARHPCRRRRARHERTGAPHGDDAEHDVAPARLARLDVREVARPHLVALVEATGETATLSVPGDEDAITVDFVSGSHQIQPVSRLGRPSIAHATSAGKVMLAFAGRELPDGPFRAYTARTITDREALASEIERVRERGYAQAAGEREPGLAAIAAPIRSARGELEAIVALQGPSERFDESAVETALPLLLEHAATISRELGWDVS